MLPSLVPLFVLEIACLTAFVAVWFALDRSREGTIYGLIALSALAIHRDNPKLAASIAAAVEANGAPAVREWFKKKFLSSK